MKKNFKVSPKKNIACSKCIQAQYIPDMTERFPEGMDGVDMTDSYFSGRGGYDPYYGYDPYGNPGYGEDYDPEDDHSDAYISINDVEEGLPWVEDDAILDRSIPEFDGYGQEEVEQVYSATDIQCKIPDWIYEYYEVVDDEEFEQQTGFPGEEYYCADNPSYNLSHVAWAIAKPEYEDALSFDAYDVMEVVCEPNKEAFLGYTAGERVYRITEPEVEGIIEDYSNYTPVPEMTASDERATEGV